MMMLLVLLSAVGLSACSSNVQSTDLSKVKIDGISIGDSFDQVKTEKYTVKTNVSNHYTYNYEEWRLSVKDGIIIDILASFDQISVSINGKENCSTVDDIIKALGNNYNSSWYDKEQGLMQIQYRRFRFRGCFFRCGETSAAGSAFPHLPDRS